MAQDVVKTLTKYQEKVSLFENVASGQVIAKTGVGSKL